MVRLVSKFTKEYVEFRDTLNNDQLLCLKGELQNRIVAGTLKENVLTTLKLGGLVQFHVYVDKSSGSLWLLGGHWVRNGEPTKGFLERMNRYAEDLLRGREPR